MMSPHRPAPPAPRHPRRDRVLHWRRGWRRAAVVGLLLATGQAASVGRARQPAVSDADLDAAGRGRTIRIGSPATGAVRTYPLETYVARVIAGEAEPDAPDPARQAVAVAIRTYATVNAARHEAAGYDLCDTTHCQVPRQATPATRHAALVTAGQILTFEGAPAPLFYSANCGGRTEVPSEVWPGARYPYLRSLPDDVHGDDPEWQLELTLVDIEAALERAGLRGTLRSVDVALRNASGRAGRVRVAGMEPEEMPGDAFRAALGAARLRSTAFTIERSGERVRFSGRGYGHGVGMCVVGAARRARRGETMEAILGAYFPGLRLAFLPAGSLASNRAALR
jgi:stage II sporulation protein D